MGWGLAIWMGVINYDNDERISADFQTKKRVPPPGAGSFVVKLEVTDYLER